MKKLIFCVLLFVGSLNAQFASSISYGQSCNGATLIVDTPRLGSDILDDPSLVGLVFFVQAAYQDIDLVISWTNGVKCTVGF